MEHLGSNSNADIGDFEKMFAVTTVMLQSVITFLMQGQPPIGQQFFLGGFYELAKFSASAFISEFCSQQSGPTRAPAGTITRILCIIAGTSCLFLRSSGPRSTCCSYPSCSNTGTIITWQAFAGSLSVVTPHPTSGIT